MKLPNPFASVESIEEGKELASLFRYPILVNVKGKMIRISQSGKLEDLTALYIKFGGIEYAAKSDDKGRK